jgi:hypothetical protein
LHWIYLGIVWGLIITAAMTISFSVLGVPSAAFCWLAWAILGQASGAYVGPTCWAVMFLAGAAAVLHQRSEKVETGYRAVARGLGPRQSGGWPDRRHPAQPRVQPLAEAGARGP